MQCTESLIFVSYTFVFTMLYDLNEVVLPVATHKLLLNYFPKAIPQTTISYIYALLYRDEQVGIDIIRKILRVPCTQIANNAGKEGKVVTERVLKERGNFGYDALNDRYCDMLEAGIIDPAKVVRQSLLDASGIASLLATAGCVMTEYSKKGD